MKILVLGCKGQLGRCLNDQLINTDHEVIYTSREQVDIADFEQTKIQILKSSPDLIINATAYTAVDKAEENQKAANLINHLAVSNIARICGQVGCWLIHVSTDYVFDGTAEIPYREDDKTNPQGVYGETKHNGELAIQSSGCKYIIIRTAWIFSEYGNNFLKTMLRLGVDRHEVRIVDDQIGSPTYAQDLAIAIKSIIRLISKKSVSSGVFNYGGNESCSWYEFAKIIFEEAEKRKMSIPSIIHPVASDAFQTQAKRPQYSVLDSSLVESVFIVRASDWRQGVIKSIDCLNKKS